MTDKIGADGSPTAIGCTDPGTCFSVYHSCTRPFRIVGDSSNGAVPRSDYTCPSYLSINEDWPTNWIGDGGEIVDASTAGIYRRESSVWSTDDYTLETVPARYREDAGGFCSEILDQSSPSGFDGYFTPSSPALATTHSSWSVHVMLSVTYLISVVIFW